MYRKTFVVCQACYYIIIDILSNFLSGKLSLLDTKHAIPKMKIPATCHEKNNPLPPSLARDDDPCERGEIRKILGPPNGFTRYQKISLSSKGPSDRYRIIDGLDLKILRNIQDLGWENEILLIPLIVRFNEFHSCHGKFHPPKFQQCP
jgi:hypothetical protein